MPRRTVSLALVLVALTSGSCDSGPTGPNEGMVTLLATGLPAGAQPAVTLTASSGATVVLEAVDTPQPVPAGRYTVGIASVEHQEDIYGAPAQPELRVTRGGESTIAATYGLISGSIAFTAQGLPAGAAGSVALSGPGGATRHAVVPGVVRGLAAGTWSVAAGEGVFEGHRYAAGSVLPIAVTASPTPALALIAYTLNSGVLEIDFDGLPSTATAAAALFGPGGRIADLVRDTTLRGLAPGSYTLSPQQALDGDVLYRANDVQTVVEASLVPSTLRANFTPRTGRIAFAVSGLPADATAQVRVFNGAAYDVLASASDTLRGVPIGNYQVEGALVSSGGTAYAAAASPNVLVEGAATSGVSLSYAAFNGFDTRLDAAYLVQSVQDVEGRVPLVSNRAAMLRVFATASHSNAFRPPVRVRLIRNGAAVLDAVMSAPTAGVPRTVNEATLDLNWNLSIPAAQLQPGTTLEVTLDPDQTLPEANRANNVITRALDVRPLGPFRARFVPIQFSQTGQTGNITASNATRFLEPTRDMLPLSDVDYDIRAPFVTAEQPLTTSNSTTWSNILGALNLAQVAEGSGRYYMGIVPVTYNSGIAGIGYVPGYTTLTWDYLPSGGGTLAHELGHNLNRRHTPCGNPAGVDPNYPYANADIGRHGFNTRLGQIVPTGEKDLMSYCRPEWISDYTFAGMLARRQATEPAASVVSGQVEDVLLVSGQITNGSVMLEPSYRLRTRAVLPTDGPHTLLLEDATGRALYRASFATTQVSHVDGVEHFTFAIPLRLLGTEASALRVTGAGGGQGEWRVPAQPALRTAGEAQTTRGSDGRVTVRWTDASVRGLMIRDAATGTVLSIVRGSSVTLPPTDATLDVLASDGLRTTVDRVRPAPR